MCNPFVTRKRKGKQLIATKPNSVFFFFLIFLSLSFSLRAQKKKEIKIKMPETYLRFGELIFVGWRYRGETGAPGCVKKATRILCRLCPLFFFFLSFRYKDTTPRHRKQCFSLGFSSIFEKKKKKKESLVCL